MDRPTVERIVLRKKIDWGELRSDQPPKDMKKTSIIVAAFGFVLAGVGIFLMTISSPDLPIGVIGFIPAIVGGWIGIKNIQEPARIQAEYEKLVKEAEEAYQEQLAEWEQFQKEHPHLEDEGFYEAALDAGITDVQSKANIARLVLWAENNGYDMTREEMIESYNIGRQEIERAEKQELIEELLWQEETDEEEYTYCAELIGRDKSAQMIEVEICACYDAIAHLKQQVDGIMQEAAGSVVKHTQKESNWATHGGIAAGIAGGAAGVAVALDTERKNQEIRQYNAQLYSVNAQLAALKSSEPRKLISQKERELEKWKKEKEKNNLRLIENLDEDKLLDGITPKIVKFENSITGAVRLTLELQPFSNLLICDDVKAVVDGSIEVSLLVNGEVVGTAIRVLPYQGITRMQKLECICRNIKKQNDKYEFSFKPIHLWAVENN